MVTSLNFAGHCRVILSMSAPSTAHMQLNQEAPLETMHVQGLKKAKQTHGASRPGPQRSDSKSSARSTSYAVHYQPPQRLSLYSQGPDVTRLGGGGGQPRFLPATTINLSSAEWQSKHALMGCGMFGTSAQT